MGTSLEMIERTYGHLVRGADDAFPSRLDAFAAERAGVEWALVEEGDSRQRARILGARTCSVGRALASQARCRGFESRRPLSRKAC